MATDSMSTEEATVDKSLMKLFLKSKKKRKQNLDANPNKFNQFP